MKKLVLFALTAGALAACQQDNKNLERKIDQLNANIERLLKSGIGGGAAAGAAGGARAPQARPPEADPAKTYAFSVEGDWFEGPKDAKVTIIEGYDYA